MTSADQLPLLWPAARRLHRPARLPHNLRRAYGAACKQLAVGFFGILESTTDSDQLIIIERNGFNNMLAPYIVCNNATNVVGNAADYVDEWEDM